MKRATIILLIIGLLVGTIVFSGSHVNAHISVETQDIENKNEEEIEESLETTKDMTYINSLESELTYYSEEEAKDLVVQKENYSREELTVGYMNENVYLVNALNMDDGTLENLFLVVNGEIVDKKYKEDGQESQTFVENFQKYQQ